jgi:hypothetical protein
MQHEQTFVKYYGDQIKGKNSGQDTQHIGSKREKHESLSPKHKSKKKTQMIK